MDVRDKIKGTEKIVSLKEKINDGAFLVDVRTPEEFECGHVDGSVNIPLDRIQLQLNHFRHKHEIIVFCRTGNRSNQAKMLLEFNGITNVTNGGTWEEIAKFVA